ncbi:MAG TPA: alkyl sulfatase dimerization domain-containing protein [Dehalococcoidia bacterium]|nr:alkyl sulfatase dimerization domain-containing protein [Dehalococcoidia bacterium]
MSDRPKPLDYRTAQGLPKEEAAFYYRGPSEEVAPGVIFFPSQGNCTVFVCGDRMLLVDTTPKWFAPGIVQDLRSKRADVSIEAIVYTHGHIDHTTGAEVWLADAERRSHSRPRIVAHHDVAARFERYTLLAEQNNFINRIQFGLPDDARPFSNVTWTYPDVDYRDAMTMVIGGERFELRHSRGETDDETWVWCPGRRTLCTGDTFVWSSPNAGNPYKVQRYAKDWAKALEEMAALRPAVLLPGHGPALVGEERIQEALLDTAQWLRSIHDQVVAGMNRGLWLEDILRQIEYPADLAKKPWLRPIYDHPEFIARNVYRLYGGWYDGNPANILPAHSEDIARELVGIAGAGPILERARRLRDDGDLRMACHLVDWVRKGEPENREAWELWRELFAARAEREESLMARGAFLSAVREAERRLKELDARG